jgi:hypothetical protein
MSEAGYRIARKGTRCGICGREFPVDEPFVSAIFPAGEEPTEEGERATFVRLDACSACFGGEEREPFSRWLTRIPPKEEKKPLLDLGLAMEFLVRLAREGDPAHVKIAFVLTLLLLRKRRVKVRGERTVDGGKVMDLTVPAADGELEIALPAPEVTADEAAEISAELNRLFGLGGEAPPAGAEAEAEAG